MQEGVEYRSGRSASGNGYMIMLQNPLLVHCHFCLASESTSGFWHLLCGSEYNQTMGRAEVLGVSGLMQRLVSDHIYTPFMDFIS